MIDLDSIRSAADRIAPYIIRTSVLNVQLKLGTELLLKPESLQAVGSFKIRGAFNRMLQLEADCLGVVAHSSGNHARAIAYAGRLLGIPSTIVMPSNAPTVKRAAVEADGARIITVGPDSEERRERALKISGAEGLVLVPPYDDPDVIAGQGTIGLEMLEQFPELDTVIVPTSGGGLIGGIAIAIKSLKPK